MPWPFHTVQKQGWTMEQVLHDLCSSGRTLVALGGFNDLCDAVKGREGHADAQLA